MAVRVKICGVTRVEDADAAVAAGADFIGLNFYPQGPRYIDLDRARAIRDVVGRRASVVGVFVNASREFIAERLSALALDLIQFHGDEHESALRDWPVPLIRALRLKPGEDPARAIASTCADFVLLDRHTPGYGGSGKALPLEGVGRLDLSRVFVAGGLDPQNVANAASLRPYAVDVASGVESAPGIKDHLKMRQFIASVRAAVR
jgi:phosphoribosylanthranilate isomerase